MESLILSNALVSRQAYEAVNATGHNESLSDVGSALWTLIDEYYGRDPEALSVNTDLLLLRADQTHPGHSETLRGLISDLAGSESPGNFTEVLLEGRRQALREEMTRKLLEGNDDAFQTLLLQFNSLESQDKQEQHTFLGTDPGALCAAVDDGERIPLAPGQLNDCVRQGLLRGHHAVVFGRPEAGKSLFAINCLATAAQAGYRVGFIENEDPIATTQLRVAQAICQATEQEVRTGNRSVREALNDAGWYDRILFRDAVSMSLHDIEMWVRHNSLDFIVVNQLPGVKVKGDSRVLELDSIARGLRGIAKSTHSAVLSVIQAGDSGDQKRVLQMGDIDFSNTAVQAACDLLIGFGVDDELETTGHRILSLCKNKLGGTHDVIRIRVDTQRNFID